MQVYDGAQPIYVMISEMDGENFELSSVVFIIH